MKKLKIFLSSLVVLLVSGGVAWAVVQTLNGQSGQTQTFFNDTNVTISSANDIHSLGWSGHLPVSRGGTGNGSFTDGSILFSFGASISQDNTNLFWDDTNNRLGVGTSSPTESVEVNGTVKATQVTTNTVSATGVNQSLSLLPTGTGKVLVGGGSIVVATKPSEPTDPQTGQIYFDTALRKFRGYDGNSWVDFNTASSSNTHSIDLEANSTQYLSITDASQTGLEPSASFTFEAWVKLESQPLADTNFTIVAKHDQPNQEGYEFAYRNANGGTAKGLWLRVSETVDGLDNDVFFVEQDLNNNTWYHVAASWVASTKTAKLYVNGVQIGGDQTGTNATSAVNNDADFTIGASAGGSSNSLFDGLIDEVRVWDDVRTTTEIDSNKNTELTGSESNLQGYWKLNNNLLDETSNNNDLTNNNSATFSTDIPF